MVLKAKKKTITISRYCPQPGSRASKEWRAM